MEIKDVFQSIPGLVLLEENLLIHGPRNKKAVPVALQKFVGCNLKDIFVDIEKEELLKLFQFNASFRDSVVKFVDVFKDRPDLFEKQLDVLGNKNLCVVSTNEGPKLLLLDPHYRNSAKKEAEKEEEIRERIAYLENLLV